MVQSVDIRTLSANQAAVERAEKRRAFSDRQSLLAQVASLEAYMRARGWLKGPTTAEYRRRCQEEDRERRAQENLNQSS